MSSFQTKITPTWCPGCGNFLIMGFIKNFLVSQNLKPHQVVITYDIGCAGNMADFINTYGVHTLHGRAIPVALGIKYFNPKLKVITVGGDGGIYGEGLNHLVAAARNNEDITVIVANNQLYGLTTGQASPTTPQGTISKSTGQKTRGIALNPVSLVKNINPKLQAFSTQAKNSNDLSEKIKLALKHKGFSLVDVVLECVTYSR